MRLEDSFLNDLASGFRIDIFGVGEDLKGEQQVTRPPAQEMAAADDFTQMGTEMAGGTEPPGATPMTLGEFATSAADVPAGLLKGAVQGTGGVFGDIESLGRAVGRAAPGLAPSQATLFPVVNAIRTLKNIPGGAIDRFLEGLEEETILPTTEDIKRFFDETLGIPLVPAGASERRTRAAQVPEFIGEMGGAGQTVIEGSRAIARGARQIGREIATTPPTGAVQMAPTPVQTPKSEIGFYSAVEETVANLPQSKGTGQQFLAQISKTAGVKPEELQWTGLDEFLKGKKSVTKAEVQDYLAANRVDVNEVRLGEGTVKPFEQWAADQGFGPEAIRDFGPTLRNSYEAFKQNASQKVGAAKYASETLPGGENYREILLTLPTDATRLRAEGDRISRLANPTPEEIETFRRANVAGASEFRSSHFDQPNILAHMRVNDRVVDGKKTLFIEEIQSDWHQAGRKKGYKTRESLENWYNQNKLETDPPFSSLNSEQISVIERNRSAGMGGDTGVPDAPFKTTWHELSLKRAIQEASEKGYDQIAFTTGKTQAERYDLSKQINSIAVPTVSPDGTRSVRINAPSESFKMMVDKDGVVTGYYSATQFTGKPLDEVVGKEMASKIMEATEPKEFSGLDLQVGGEGMKGFYDNILPKSLDKLGKKFDAKVGKTEMDGVEVWKMDITPKMRESAVSKGQPLFVAPVVAPGMVQDEGSK
jgi:hypothetical protein